MPVKGMWKTLMRDSSHSSQLACIRAILLTTGRWWTLADLVRELACLDIMASEAGVSARLRELRGKPHYMEVERRIMKGHRNLYEYRVRQRTVKEQQAQLFEVA
jgi:hypothetical protein